MATAPLFLGPPVSNPGVIAWPGLNDAAAVPPGTIVANGLPAQVSIQAGSTAPSPSLNQQTALPTPANVQNSPASSTVLTSAGGQLIAEVEAIVTNPSQHIIG